MENTDYRSPEEIESDIERTRADFSSTIDAIKRKLTPSEMMDQAVDYAMSTTPGAFSMNLVNSVRENPLPVALIGIGIAWLMRAERQPREPYRRSRAAYPYGEAYEGTADDDYLAARDYGSGADATGSTNGIMQRAASKTSETARGLKDSASQAGQRISSTAASVAERAQQASQSAKSRLQETAQSAKMRASELGQRTQMQAGRAKERFGQMADEQPFVLSAIGLAIGAALGAAMPTTRRENEMMGSLRDDLLEKAKGTALEQAEVLKQSAQRVAESAKAEAGKLAESMPSGAGQQGGQGASASGKSQFGDASSASPSIH